MMEGNGNYESLSETKRSRNKMLLVTFFLSSILILITCCVTAVTVNKMCEKRAKQCNDLYKTYANSCFMDSTNPVFECKMLLFLDNQSVYVQTFMRGIKECLSLKQFEVMELCLN